MEDCVFAGKSENVAPIQKQPHQKESCNTSGMRRTIYESRIELQERDLIDHVTNPPDLQRPNCERYPESDGATSNPLTPPLMRSDLGKARTSRSMHTLPEHDEE
jgi:hypothetical protein